MARINRQRRKWLAEVGTKEESFDEISQSLLLWEKHAKGKRRDS